MALLAGSLSEVFFQKAAKSYQETGAYWPALRFNLVVSGGLALAILFATLLLARWAIGIYLGPGWAPVGDVLVLLAPMMAARFVFITISAAPLVTGRTRWLLVANATLALSMAAIFILAKIRSLSFEAYLQLFSIGTAGLYAVLAAAISLTAYRHYRIPKPKGASARPASDR
jgi:O-antigen/teichoic acid export membrane protein